MKARLTLTLLLAACGTTAAAQGNPPADMAPAAELPPPPVAGTVVRTGPDADQRVAWWREARVGMFIHFGLYAIPGRGEWVMWNEQIPREEYALLADEFRPDPAAPFQWAAVARRAGLNYVVLTSRHHDGFALFDSSANAFNTKATAAGQDIVGTFLEAVRAEGLRTGLYYSPLDWRYPGYFFPDLYQDSALAMRDQYHREINDLATNYGPIDLLWFDGGGNSWLGFGGVEFRQGVWRRRPANQPYSGRFDWLDDEAVGRLRASQPGILINDRTDAPADWHDREGVNRLGDFDDQTPWELCFTLAGPWGYRPGAVPRSMNELVSLVTRVATRDGNTLINVGPAPDGSIPGDQIRRLEELGDWLGAHGEAIYDTRGGPFIPVDGVGSTRSGESVFLHILPNEQGRYPVSVNLPELAGTHLTSASRLGEGSQPGVRPDATGAVVIMVPAPGPDDHSIILRLRYDRAVDEVRARDLPAMQLVY